MKKVFLLSLGLVLGFSAFAQKQVSKNDKQSFTADSKKVAVGTEMVSTASSFAPQTKGSMVQVNRWEDMLDAETMYTNYDLQSNYFISNRMYQLPNGSVAVTATMSHEPNQTASDRGTGYNFYNGSEWGEMPDTRIEDMRTGWPTIAQWGATGEILISHTPLRCWTREVAGQGEWQYRGELPINPEGYPYTDDPSWPRVATSGDNHNIIHVVADIQHSGDVVEHHQVYLRSEDAENWTITFSPLAQDGEETGHYSADSYAIAANGHNVAIIYSGDMRGHVVMYKSTNDGETWTRTVIWENPYYGYDWETDENSIYTEELYRPDGVSIVIDNDGVVHVAMNVYEMIHSELGTTYTYYLGRTVDGIYYWNDTKEAPIQALDGNPHHAMRLWLPDPEDTTLVYHSYDTVNFCGWIPFEFEGFEWSNDLFYHESDYINAFMGASALPSLSCDPDGNLAVAYTTPYTLRTNGSYYFRQVFVNYKSKDNDYWTIDYDNLMNDFLFEYTEGTGVNAVPNTARVGEFWFSYQADDIIGFYWGSNATQASASDNYIHAVMVRTPDYHENVTEANNVVYNIYPNPATDYIVVSSAMDANATISFVNLAGQTVKVINKSLTTGDNSINIDLNSGVYFCTVTANGFNKTTKVIVK